MRWMAFLSAFCLLTGSSPLAAKDGTSFNPLPVELKVQVSSLPVGSIIAWPVNSMPDGSEAGKWLECNGQSTTAYPALAAIIGATVPDYRGMFLRGHGTQSSSHYGNVSHASGGLGEVQGDAMRKIWGTGLWWNVYRDTRNQLGGALYLNDVYGHQGSDSTDYDNFTVDFDSSLVVPTADETRPVNMAVKYLIRAAR